jgi:4'-phosphopantetheinyl transferase
VPDALRTVAAPVLWLLADADPLPDWVHPSPLTAAELARADSIRHPAAKRQFVRGRAVLRSALSVVLGLPAAEVPVVLDPDGKPVLDTRGGFADLHFNLSHTTGVALFAVSRVPVGVDVEAHRVGRDLPGLVGRYFTDAEREQFERLPDDLRAAAFLRGWTCKEAVLKGIGCGVRGLRECVVDLDPRRPAAVSRAPDGGAWALTCWAAGDGIAAAVATRG